MTYQNAVAAVVTMVVSLVPAAVMAAPGDGPTVVVIGMGEQLLAGEVEAQLERTLADRGVAVVDERGLPAAQVALGDRTGPLQPSAVTALKPHADLLLLVTADYLGNRRLLYMNRYDEAYQSRLTVTAVPLFGTSPPAPVLNTRVEYTAESLESAASAAVRPAVAPLLERLGRE